MSDASVDNFFEIVDNIFHKSERLGWEFEQILEDHLDELYERDDIMTNDESTKIVPITPTAAKMIKWPSIPPFIIDITNQMIVEHLQGDRSNAYLTARFTRVQLMNAVLRYITSIDCLPSDRQYFVDSTTNRAIEDRINQAGWLDVRAAYSADWHVNITTQSNGEAWTYTFKSKTIA